MKTVLILMVLLIIGGTLYYSGKHTMDLVQTEEDFDLKKFSSYEELEDFLEASQESGRAMYDMAVGGVGPEMMMAEAAGAPSAKAAGADEFSTTNIQVEGVDEADIIKNDGKYIYAVSGSKIVIVDAFPAENAEVLSEIDYEGSPIEIFINEDRLIVFGRKQTQIIYAEEGISKSGDAKFAPEPWPYPRYEQRVSADIYDVSDREDPDLVDEIKLRGNYFDSRMIGDYVYLIANENVYWVRDRPIPMPMLERNGAEQEVPVSDIMYHPYPDYSYRYTNILAINTQNKNKDVAHKVILTGSTQNLYMSINNLYLTSIKRRRWIDYRRTLLEKTVLPLLPTKTASKIVSIAESGSDYKTWNTVESTLRDYTESLTTKEEATFNEKVQEKVVDVQKEWAKESEKTVVHRISINKDDIDYEAEGEVPGRVLNQFSMDEFDSHFRIATTAGHASTRSGEETSTNNVYVLNMGLKVVGEVEDLAPGEKIYSARFMGKRLYLVTFRNIDPLFVIDLANPENPKVLGKLKIPGYSDYLHPYDENTIIGLGKWTTDAKDRDFAWYQGVKLSLFDVSDVSKPKEIDKYEIGDRGTDSYALHDHKAFLFDKDKNLLVIPILLAEIDEEQYPKGREDSQRGDYKFQGAYVFHVDDDGFELTGRVTHIEDDETFLKSGYYYYNDAYSIKRTLYMDDVLYTISSKLIKMNDLDDLDELNEVELPYEVYNYNYGYSEPGFVGGPEVIAVEA